MAAARSLPRVESLPLCRHRFVLHNGQPFFLRAAELQNSSFSSVEYMEKIWPKLVAQHVNTALGPIAWEDIEPVEGHFEWDLLEGLIAGARKHEIKLVLLWFGAWKNGMSTYVPNWVKKDATRFPRCRIRSTPDQPTEMVEVLTPFSTPTLEADAKAFTALMTRLKDVDSTGSTVIMVQVENEVGLLGDSRDRSTLGETAFHSLVPDVVTSTLNEAIRAETLAPIMDNNIPNLATGSALKGGLSWRETFGDGPFTDELFMAYHYATHISRVVAAGQQVHNLPMFTNGWLRTENSVPSSTAGGGALPGQYPSGGPADSVIDIYQLFAPNLAFVSPDIYLVDYAAICAAYKHRGQPLFVPEHRRDEYGALRIWEAIGEHGAIAMSPFGIDTLDPATSVWAKHYGLLRKAEVALLAAWERGARVTGFYFDRVPAGQKDTAEPRTVVMGHWTLQIQRAQVFGAPEPGFGIVIQETDDSFLLVGEGYMVSFRSTDPRADFTGILSLDELEVVNDGSGTMKKVRRLNGDEIKSGQAAVMPVMGSGPDYGDFPIPITIPGETGLARCMVYRILDQS